MQCHNQNESCYFETNSSFKPFVSPIALLGQTQAEPKKKEPPKYLPGEKLLISLHKNRQKEKKKNDDEIDVLRITQSLSRVLSNF
jgi:hypothetical protein